MWTKGCVVTIIVGLLAITSTVLAQDTVEHELVEKACLTCHCTVKRTTSLEKYYEQQCTARDLQQTFSGYPIDFFGTSQAGSFINSMFDHNAISHLKKLSATDASFAFSCQYCKIMSIASAAFADIPHIFRIDLSRNELTSTALRPDVFYGIANGDQFDTMNLTELDLSHNHIEHLDRNLFTHLVSLKRLTISYNAFGSLTEDTIVAIGGLSSLKQLDLSFTGIDTLPNEMLHGMQLNELNVQGNRLLAIPESLASQRGSLHVLNIRHNLCRQLDDENFLGLSLLKHLMAGYMMDLEEITSGTFHSLVSLEILDLSHSPKLNSINLGGLVASTNLKILDISNCSMTTLNLDMPGVLDASLKNDTTMDVRFPKLRSLMMKGNPWHCDCSLYKSLYKLMRLDKNMFFSQYNARCATPYHLVTDLLVDLLVDPDKCSLTNNRKPPRIIKYDPPAFLRPRSLLVTILSVLAVVLIGLVIGLAIVIVQKKLREREVGLDSTVRYTTVRNSTTSAMSVH